MALVPMEFDQTDDYVILQAANKENVSIAGSSFSDITVPYTVPTGYEMVGIVDAIYSSSYSVPFNNYISGNNFIVSIRNYSQGSVSGTVQVRFLCRKIS